MTIEQLRLRPKFVEAPDGNLCIWEPPFDSDSYVIGIDAASGLLESDNSVAEILNITKGRQIGELCGQIAPEKLADDSVALGWWFNTAMLYPEINSIGVVTMKRIKQVWQYPRVGREEKWDEIGVKLNKYGHFTNHDQKVIMVSFLRYLIRERFLAIASDALLAELSTFVQNVTKDGTETYAADANNKDDRVMALMLACFCVRQNPRMLKDLTKEDNRWRLPTAREAGIHDAPVMTVDPFKPQPAWDALPQQVREGLGFSSEVLSVPSNPIRGEMEILV